jgi:hypothetical protein
MSALDQLAGNVWLEVEKRDRELLVKRGGG